MIIWKPFVNGYPLNDLDVIVFSKKLNKYITEYVDSDFFMRVENLEYTKWCLLQTNNYYTCDMCNDNLVVEVGENEYSECPCVKDNEKDIERQAKDIVTEICTLFHLQESMDWEQKAIDIIKPLIK